MKSNAIVRTFAAAVLAAGVCLSSHLACAQAVDQPKPGPELKRLEALAGKWQYEGEGFDSPFGPASSFKGTSVSRMVLGGFFLETREEDRGDNGYLFQGTYLKGFDTSKKCFFHQGYENDGTVTFSEIKVDGRAWSFTGERLDAKGKAWKTRSVQTYAADGRSGTFVTEYLAEDGTTWRVLWKGTTKRVDD